MTLHFIGAMARVPNASSVPLEITPYYGELTTGGTEALGESLAKIVNDGECAYLIVSSDGIEDSPVIVSAETKGEDKCLSDETVDVSSWFCWPLDMNIMP